MQGCRRFDLGVKCHVGLPHEYYCHVDEEGEDEDEDEDENEDDGDFSSR